MERSVKCHASESVIDSYAIVINNIINEVKDRINSSVDSYDEFTEWEDMHT
jgi:hypothetical protein